MESTAVRTGKRKEATATVRMFPGGGKITVNGVSPLDYFKRETMVMLLEQPLLLTETADKFDIYITAKGGGLTGQAGAARLGVARALAETDETLRETLRSAGFLTRDSREKERKKYGLAGARKRYQFSKR